MSTSNYRTTYFITTEEISNNNQGIDHNQLLIYYDYCFNVFLAIAENKEQ